MLFIFASTFACAARSASFAAAMTRSASISGSSGSIAFGSIRSSLISPPAVATTVTMPPPAVASAVSFAASSCISFIWACICWACCISALMSKLMPAPRGGRSFVHLPCVEGALHQLQHVLLAGRSVVSRLAVRLLAELERDGELAARHLVERIAQERGVLRVLRELQVEGRGLRKLQRERVALERGRVGLAERLADRDRALLDRRQDRPPPCLLELLELDRQRRDRRLGRRRLGRLGHSGTWF